MAGGESPQVVQTEDGPVSVTSIEYLQQLASAADKRAGTLQSQVADKRSEVATLQARAGAELVAREKDWASTDRAGRIEAARSLSQLVADLEQRLADVKARPHHGLGGIVDRVKDSRELSGLQHQLQSACAELDNRHRAVVDQLTTPTGLASADDLLTQADSANARATELEAARSAASAEFRRLTEEISRRNSVVHGLGFDALGIQADLSVNGIRPAASTLVLKAKEVAAVQVPATLCRFATQTRYVGASQGVSIPLGHGLRYRVSGYQGHPIESQYLAQVDMGQLVVTNQRLVFLGAKKDVSVPLAKLLQVEPYSDAIGIGREGKESRDIFLVARPALVLLYLQWVISRQSQ
jgi:hypothetical protein